VRPSRLEESTYQAHSTITNPVDMRSILAEFGGWQLALASDFADGFFDFVHGECREGKCWSVGWLVEEDEPSLSL
jgi:hypothetical protein